MKEYIITFFTHSGAIVFDRMCKKKEIKCELMPVPRKLSSNCGIGAKVFFDNDIKTIIDEEIEKVFAIEGAESVMVYEAED